MGEIDTKRLYLNGQWVPPANPLDVLNPATGEVLARVGTLNRRTVGQALAHAQTAWDEWRRQSGKTRGQYLRQIAHGLELRGDEIARTITLENGKPLPQARAELNMTLDHLRWFAAEAQRAYGRIVPHQIEGKRHMVLRVPVGVAAAIAPWNFPLVLAVRKLAPALAAGCPVLLKPASATPLSSVLLAEVIDQVGLPPGVFQLLLGPSAEIGAELLENPICRKISFTGSTAVGKQLIAGSAQTVTNLSLELGGHAPVLVFDDCDFDQAVHGAMIAKTRNSGQSCIAANRIYVQRSIYPRFLEAFTETMAGLKTGDGFEEDVEIGPLIDAAALDSALEQIDQARSQGARLLCGGNRLDRPGYFLPPTVLADVSADSLCMREETFAPVAPVSVFDDEEEALRQANHTPYGLAAYAFSQDLSRVWRLAERLEAGTIAINDSVPAASQCPFGGMKQSGLGRELGTEGLDAFLETKHISLGVDA